MSVKCRVIKGGECEVTQSYIPNKHNGIDLVNKGYTLGNITAHSDGVVVETRDNATGFENNSYGNYIKIKHDDGYYTLYAHGKYKSLRVKNGAHVKKGDELMEMGNTGTSYGAHLHFEVRNPKNARIDPTYYINNDLPSESKLKHKLGEVVSINKVYVSSESLNPLTPAITKGKITRVIDGAHNPYLLENGNIGWVNDNCIIDEKTDIRTIKNCYYLNLRTSASYGNNIYSVVQAGTKVEYLGEENGWAKIKYNNKILYCGKGYLG